MATSFNVAEITANVATLTGSPTFSATTRVTATQVTYWFSQAVRAISALLRQKFPEDRDLVSIATPATTPGLNLVTLPVDTGEVLSVVWARGVEDYVLLRAAQQDDLVYRTAKDWTTFEPRYRIEGQTLAFYPPPSAAYALEVFYTQNLAAAATIISRVDVDQWIALFIARYVAISKKQSPALFDQQRSLIENDLLSIERERDAEVTHTIRDVRGERRYAFYRQRYS